MSLLLFLSKYSSHYIQISSIPIYTTVIKQHFHKKAQDFQKCNLSEQFQKAKSFSSQIYFSMSLYEKDIINKSNTKVTFHQVMN